MLERRRLLKARSQAIENGHRIIVYEHVRTGEVFTIADPGLRLDQLETVQQDVAKLLEHGPAEELQASANQTEQAKLNEPAVVPSDQAPAEDNQSQTGELRTT